MGTHHQDETRAAVAWHQLRRTQEYEDNRPHLRERESAALRYQTLSNAVDKEVPAKVPACKSVTIGHPGFYELLSKMGDIHSRKNGNYAKASDPLSNFRMSLDLGIDPFNGCLIRMSDKWSRICQLSKGVPDLVGESLEDTLIDLANYSIISILLLREKRAKRGDNAS